MADWCTFDRFWVLISKTIAPPGQSCGQRYDFMQMHYSCQLLTILLLCVYLRRRFLQMRCSFLWGQKTSVSYFCLVLGPCVTYVCRCTCECACGWVVCVQCSGYNFMYLLPFGGRRQHQIVSQSYYNCACNFLCLFQAEICYILIILSWWKRKRNYLPCHYSAP